MADNQPYDPSVICSEEGNFLYFGFAPCMINIPRYKGQDLQGGSVLKLKKLQEEKKELLESLELYCRVVTLGQEEQNAVGD